MDKGNTSDPSKFLSGKGKGNQLVESELTDEVIESSKSILTGNRGNGNGLQQYFTPPDVCQWISLISNIGNTPVFDPTAGNGNLLAPYDNGYGVEISPEYADNIDNRHRIIQGDIQAIIPLLIDVGISFHIIHCNPPFGLQWIDHNTQKSISSTAYTFKYGIQLLRQNGLFVFISGKDRIDREIISNPEYADNIFARVNVNKLFDNVDLSCSIIFATIKSRNTSTIDILEINVDHYNDLTPTIANQIKSRYDYFIYSHYFGTYEDYEIDELDNKFKAVRAEHRHRQSDKQNAKPEYTLSLKQGKIHVYFSAYQKLSYKGNHDFSITEIESCHGNTPNYYAMYKNNWLKLLSERDKGNITIEPTLVNKVNKLIDKAYKEIIPLYEPNPIMRLGWLDNVDKLRCIKSDPIKKYVENTEYDIHTYTEQYENSYTDIIINPDTGKESKQDKIRVYQRLVIRIGNHNFKEKKSGELQSELLYVIEHFELPNPGDISSRYGNELSVIETQLLSLQNNHFKFKPFQTEDIAKLIFKRGGFLSWDTGLGKTVAGLTFIEYFTKLKNKKNCLIICPQDLIKQWQDEAKKFYGMELEVITSLEQAIRIRERIKNHPERQNICITYYEALAIKDKQYTETHVFNNRKYITHKIKLPYNENHKYWERTAKCDEHKRPRPDICDICQRIYITRRTAGNTSKLPQVIKLDLINKFIERHTSDHALHGKLQAKYDTLVNAHPHTDTSIHLITPETNCPNCKSHINKGKYNKKHCKRCNWNIKDRQVKPAYRQLCKLFDVLIVDEATKMQGDNSMTSESIRAFTTPIKLTLSATPIKNYIPSIFHPLGWTMGYNSIKFPYRHDGKMNFIGKYAVAEYTIDKAGRKQSKKILAQVTNITSLWRLIGSSMVRRRKENTGEPIVDKNIHVMSMPMGKHQRDLYDRWMNEFADYFMWKHPDTNLSPQLIERFSLILGKLQKLRFITTLPANEKDQYFKATANANCLPKNYAMIKTIMQQVKQGKKVLVLSDIQEHSTWLEPILKNKGIRTSNIVQINKKGKAITLAPAKRSNHIKEFKHGDTQVLLAGIQTLKLGHSLPEVQSLVINGLAWDYESYYQAISRIHRINSEKNVDIFIYLTNNTVDTKMWNLINEKQTSSNLALDGSMLLAESEEVDMNLFLKELKQDWNATVFKDVIDEDYIKSKLDILTLSNCDSQDIISTAKPEEEDIVLAIPDIVEQYSTEEQIKKDEYVKAILERNERIKDHEQMILF